jgi:hypothetical protein
MARVRHPARRGEGPIYGAQTPAETLAGVTPTSYLYDQGYIERYGGAIATDSSAALETAGTIGRQDIKFYNTGSTLVLNDYSATYLIRDAFLDRTSLVGPANFASDGTQTTSMLRLGQDPDQANGFQWRSRTVSGITFSGKQRADTAVSFGDADEVVNQYANSWNFHDCTFERCDKGILKEDGHFGQSFTNCNSQSGNFFYHATGRASAAISHVGNDYFLGGEHNGNRLAVFYIDGQQVAGTGATILDQVIIENNAGYGLFIKDYNNAAPAFECRSCWFEALSNATATSVDLADGAGSRTPRSIYLENVDMFRFIGSSIVPDMEVIDSNVIIEGSSLQGTVTSVLDNSTGSANYIVARNVHITGFGDTQAPSLIVESIARADTTTGTTLRQWAVPPRTNRVSAPPGTGTYEGGDTFEYGEDLIETTPTPSNNRAATIVAGATFPTASQYALNLSATDWEVGATPSALSITAGKWLVVTQEIKLDSGEISRLQYSGSFSYTRDTGYALVNANVGEWRTIGFVAEVASAEGGVCRLFISTASAKTAVVTLGASQTIQFDSAQEAYDYFNSRTYCADTEKVTEVVTATNVILPSESGKTFQLNTAGGFTSTLPPPKDGMNFKFFVKTAPTTDYVITTDSGDNILNGVIIEAAGTNEAVIAQDTLSFAANKAGVGDTIEVTSEGATWSCKAITSVNAGITKAVT